MVPIKRATLASVLILAIMTGLAALTAAPATAQTVRWVKASDTTPVAPGASCRDAGYTTISAAVTAAAPGDIIKVCPGTYAESVTVNKPLTLQGFNTTDGKCFNRTLTPDPSRDTIVNPPSALSGIGFDVTVGNVTIRGFIITDADTGIQTGAATAGHTLEENTLLLNRFGAHLASNGTAPTTVTKNCFRQNAAAAGGDAIFSNQGVTNVLIGQNRFFKTVHVAPATEAADIVMFGAPLVPVRDVRISRNKSRGSETFASLAGSVNSTITDNKIKGDGTASAIFAGGNTSGLVVSKNKIKDARRGVRFCAATCAGGAPATGVQVARNKIKDVVEDGIVANPASLTNSVIVDNDVRENGRDGIRIEDTTTPGNAGNLFWNNHAHGNLAFDCRDQTTGVGTAGTANTWQHNKGKTSSPPEICRSVRR